MSLKDKVTQIATQTATQVAQQLISIRMQQFSASLSNMATVAKVDGTQVTLNMPNGVQTMVTNAGSRIVGPGDPMITDGQNVAL